MSASRIGTRSNVAALVMATATLAMATLTGCGGGDGTTTPTPGGAAMLEATTATSVTATVASAVTVSVVARDASRSPVRDVVVSFRVTEGGGSVASPAVTTDASGVATTTWTLGIGATANTLVASAPTVAQGVTFTAVGRTGPAASLRVVSGDEQMGQTGAPLPELLRVQVVDAHGNGVAGGAVGFAVSSGGGSITAAPVPVDATGIASAAWTLGAAAGAQAATATMGGMTATFRATADPDAALVILPSLGTSADARSIDDAGTMIAGWSRDESGRVWAVRWTRSSATGRWTIATLPHPANATSWGVDALGYVAGYAENQSMALLWTPGGDGTILGCPSDVGRAQVLGISGTGQVVVGARTGESPVRAAAWRPGQCRALLPSLGAAGAGIAHAANGDGSIVVGTSGVGTDLNTAGAPVRWTHAAGDWQVRRLDERPGHAFGANAAGDAVGLVAGACGSALDCPTSVLWYVAGGSRDIGALESLGGDASWARDVNAAGEVVGIVRKWEEFTRGYFWSATPGARALPDFDRSAWANGVSGLRADGTRMVVGGMGSADGTALLGVVWVIRDR